MDDFKIRRGLSTTLFAAPGVVNPNLIVEKGCWYLCTDTAELYVGIENETGTELHKVNSVNLDDIKTDLADLKNTVLFKKIANETELPTDFDSEGFNPNITYFMMSDAETDLASLFIFDAATRCYLKVDISSSGMSSVSDLTEAETEELLSTIDGYTREETVSE